MNYTRILISLVLGAFIGILISRFKWRKYFPFKTHLCKKHINELDYSSIYKCDIYLCTECSRAFAFSRSSNKFVPLADHIKKLQQRIR